jgi:hypothetical protein
LSAAIALGLDNTQLTQRAALIARDNAAMPDLRQFADQITALNQ